MEILGFFQKVCCISENVHVIFPQLSRIFPQLSREKIWRCFGLGKSWERPAQVELFLWESHGKVGETREMEVYSLEIHRNGGFSEP